MTHNLKELYNKLSINPDKLTTAKMETLEDWIQEHVSQDIISPLVDLKSKLATYEKNLTPYFEKRTYSIIEPDLLTLAVRNGFDVFLDEMDLSADQINDTPNLFRLAVVNGHLHTLQALLSKGLLLPESMSQMLHTALTLPFRHSERLQEKKEAMFKFLVKTWPELLNEKAKDKNNIIHTMAENNYTRLIEHYLESNPDMAEEINNLGHYPVTCAILNNHHQAVELFLTLANIPNLVDKKKRLPLHYAGRYGDARMVSLCTEANPSLLNQPDMHGQTPLHLACIDNNNDAVEILLGAGANVNVIDSLNRTALHYAVINKNQALVKRLLSQLDIDYNLADANDLTPLDYAANTSSSGSEEIKQLLMDNGALATGKTPEESALYLY